MPLIALLTFLDEASRKADGGDASARRKQAGAFLDPTITNVHFEAARARIISFPNEMALLSIYAHLMDLRTRAVDDFWPIMKTWPFWRREDYFATLSELSIADLFRVYAAIVDLQGFGLFDSSVMTPAMSRLARIASDMDPGESGMFLSLIGFILEFVKARGSRYEERESVS